MIRHLYKTGQLSTSGKVGFQQKLRLMATDGETYRYFGGGSDPR